MRQNRHSAKSRIWIPAFAGMTILTISALALAKTPAKLTPTPSQKVCRELENALAQRLQDAPIAKDICKFTNRERDGILVILNGLADVEKVCEDLDKIPEGGDEAQIKDLTEKCGYAPTLATDLASLISSAQNELANRQKTASKQRPKLKEIKKLTKELKKISQRGSPGSYAKVAPRVTQYLEGAKKPAPDSPNLGTDTSAKPPASPGESGAGPGTAPGPAAEKTGDRPTASPPGQPPGTAPGESAPADLVKLKGNANGNQSPINQSIKVNKVGGKEQPFGRIFLDSGIDISASEKISQRVGLTAETCQGEGDKKTCNYYPLGTVSLGAIETKGDLRHQIKRGVGGKDYLLGISPNKGKLEIGVAEKTEYTSSMAEAFGKSSTLPQADKGQLDELTKRIAEKQKFMNELEDKRKRDLKGYKDLKQKEGIETMRAVLGGVSRVIEAEKAGKAEKDELKNAIAKANEELTKFGRHFAGKFDEELSGHAEITADDIKKGQAQAAQRAGQAVTLANGEVLRGVVMPVFNKDGNPFFEADENARQSLCLVDEEGNAQGCMTTLARDGKFRVKEKDTEKAVKKAEVKLASGDKVQFEYAGKKDGKHSYKITTEIPKKEEPTPAAPTSADAEKKSATTIDVDDETALDGHIERYKTKADCDKFKEARWFDYTRSQKGDAEPKTFGLCVQHRKGMTWVEPAVNPDGTRLVFTMKNRKVIDIEAEIEPASGK